ncbi:MAG TPA: thioredoxin family protein [Ktedonobacterales bacterium]
MRLDIYIADHCENCQESLRLAALARTSAPGVDVRVINLDTTSDAIPPRVIATPTYMLDNRVVSLGNPRPDELLRLLSEPAREDVSGSHEETRS